MIEAPPRHGKSEYTSKYLPAWYVGRFPHKRVILTSYEANFAKVWGRRAKGLLDQWGKPLFDIKLSRDKASTSDWETSAGGGMITAGVGGPITGRGADLFIVDDAIKNAEQALSPRIRETQWDWWGSTAITRLEPGALAVVMMTRWHRLDLIGRLLEEAKGDGSPVFRFSMPAIAKDGDQLGREPGEALWPERWPVKDLLRRKAGMDPYWWASLFQQEPGEHGRTEWPAEYFQGIEADYWPSSFEHCVVCLDPSKGKDAKRGDYSALVFAGLKQGKLYVRADLARRPVTQICEDGVNFYLLSGADAFGVEANAFQDLLAPEFDRVCMARNLPPLPIRLINNQVAKPLRISRIGPYLARKLLRFASDPGTKLLISQLRENPHGDHDDGPDALEMCIRLLNWECRQAAAGLLEESVTA